MHQNILLNTVHSPQSKLSIRNIKNASSRLKLGAFLLAAFVFTTIHTFGQISFTENFDVAPTGWTGNFAHLNNNTACGTPAMRKQIFSFSPGGNMISPNAGTSLGGVITLTYDYKVATWASGNTAGAPNPWGSFNVKYGSSATGPWTTVDIVNSGNHVVSSTCSTMVVTFTPPTGALFIKWDASYTSGDFYLNFDNVSVTEATGSACSGTPAPGNTQSTATSVCPNDPFTLSLQNATSGTGVNYVWESADDMNFTVGVNTLPSISSTQFITSQTSSKYYRCQVTCGASSTYSNPIQVMQNPGTSCYCIPSYNDGVLFGDLMSNVTVLGTTLANSSGSSTSAPSYTHFTGVSNYTGFFQAGVSYSALVTAGPANGQNVAIWIDYDDDGIFSTQERVGFTTNSVSAFSTVSIPIVVDCNAPVGVHRMRIRDVGGIAGSSISPCDLYGFGETEDYDITITAAAPCPVPTALVASSPTATSVLLTWDAGCTENAWKVEYGPSGFSTGSGTLINVNSNPYTVTGLSCGTIYDFYVYADCGGSGLSTVSNASSLSTTACACSGTPTPGNTTSSVPNTCSYSPFTLSLQSPSTDSGLTYAWESANDASFTQNVQSLSSITDQQIINNQTIDTYYRCLVTCTNSGLFTYSTPVFVGQLFGTQCICTPTYTIGKTNGDLIANVSIAATTLSNNSGTSPVNPAYTYYTGFSNFTGSMQAGSSYVLTMAVGFFGNQNIAAWIDYDDDGTFDSSEQIGFTTAALPASGSTTFTIAVPTTAPSGMHRMRIRSVKNVAGNTIHPCLSYAAGETEDYDITVTGGVSIPTINVTAFIEGYYDAGTGLMTTVIENSQFISPALTTNCDTITVELHAPNSTLSVPVIVESFTGVIQTNGTLTSTFPSYVAGNKYYIVLKHRSAIETWSADSVLMGGTISYDFSNAANVFGANVKLVNPGVYAMFSGDINYDFVVDTGDYPIWETDANAFAFGYVTSDLNGDGVSDLTDYAIWESNANSFIFVNAPF